MKKNGYTSIEVMIVVAIVGILIAIGLGFISIKTDGFNESNKSYELSGRDRNTRESKCN